MKTFQFLIASLLCASTLLRGQDVKVVAEREAARRQARIPQGEELAARGETELADHQFAQAHEDFRLAVNYIPPSSSSYQRALDGFCESGVKLAEERSAEGKYAEAEQVLNEVLSERYNPNCREARTLLGHLRDPGYVNRTNGPQFLAKVEQVKQWLTEAEGFYQSGRYDLAMKRYDQVLNLDPYNTAARKGQERIDQTKYQYGKQAYNEKRGRSMWEVEKGWEEPVKRYGVQSEPITGDPIRSVSNTAAINEKLNKIIIPLIEFQDSTVLAAFNFLRQQGVANDTTPGGKRGVDIVVRLTPHNQPSSTRTGAVGVSASGTTTPPPAGETAPPPASTSSPGQETSPIVGSPTNSAEPRVTLNLTDIPLGEAIRYVAAQAGLKVKVEQYAVLVLPLSEKSDELITRRYHVPPEFFGAPMDIGFHLAGEAGAAAATTSGGQPGAGQGGGGQTTLPLVGAKTIDESKEHYTYTVGGNGQATGTAASDVVKKYKQELINDRKLVGRASAQDWLESMGVGFPTFQDAAGNITAKATAAFLPGSATLIVRNTQDNLDMVDALVDQANLSRPRQVEIESKFVEITQNNLKELGFDWLLGPFNLPGSHKIFGSGGTVGNGQVGQFPIVNANGSPVGLPVTAGNRSGDFAISANAIDALLAGTGAGAATAAPGIFGLTGLLTDPQFQVVIRALNQRKGIDLLSAPRVTTKSGQRAVIEIIREFKFPTQFTPPQVPNISGGGTGTTIALSAVTPTTPTAFDTRNTGVTLEVEPLVSEDGTTIDLNLVPEVVEFEGFVNYGSPIFGINPSFISGVLNSQVLLTQNVINQPIFSTRRVTTSVSVYDGATVVLGGLMREDVQKTEDRTPIVGDIPIVGRLFRTNSEQHTKRNLVIFVTARLLSPAGEGPDRVDEEETVIPPELPEVPMYKK